MAFVYDSRTRRYRDVDTGRFVSQEQMYQHSFNAIEGYRQIADANVDAYINGELTLAEFGEAHKEIVKRSAISQSLLGIGGRDSATPQSWGAVGNFLAGQYRLIDIMLEQIADGFVSEATLRNRVGLYINSTRFNFERARGLAHELNFPAYPRDGSTKCQGGCLCTWRVLQDDGGGNAIAKWEIRPAEHCIHCLNRSVRWARLIFERGEPLLGDTTGLFL